MDASTNVIFPKNPAKYPGEKFIIRNTRAININRDPRKIRFVYQLLVIARDISRDIFTSIPFSRNFQFCQPLDIPKCLSKYQKQSYPSPLSLLISMPKNITRAENFPPVWKKLVGGRSRRSLRFPIHRASIGEARAPRASLHVIHQTPGNRRRYV